MLPQKKSLLRRNAWYRQQLIQQVPAGANPMIELDRHCNTSQSATPTTKPQPVTESSRMC